MPLYERFPEPWMADNPAFASEGEDFSGGFPALPEYDTPNLQTMPPMTRAERMGQGFLQLPAYQPQPYEGGGSAFLRALLTGAARGYGSAVEARRLEKQKELDALNEQEKARVQSQNLARRDWMMYALPGLLRLAQPKADKVPGLLDMTPEQFALYESRYRKLHPGSQSAEPKPYKFRWSPTNAASIGAAERLYADAKAGKASASGVSVDDARARLDRLRKADMAAQLRGAKSLEEAEAIATAIFDLYPGLNTDPSRDKFDSMIARIARDKRREFGAR